MEKVSQLMRMNRAKKRLTLRDLAFRTQYTFQYLSEVELQKKSPHKPNFYRRISEALGISKEEMIKAVLEDRENELIEKWDK